MGGRERLVARMGRLAADPVSPPIVMITHHVEEIPSGFTHVLLLREGRVVSAGPIEDCLTASALSATFGMELMLDGAAGRWHSRAVFP
jgi:iron complex transport system ATP-binding protein